MAILNFCRIEKTSMANDALKIPTAAEISSWTFDIRNGNHLTKEIIEERRARVGLLPPSPQKSILQFELRHSLDWHKEFAVEVKKTAH